MTFASPLSRAYLIGSVLSTRPVWYIARHLSELIRTKNSMKSTCTHYALPCIDENDYSLTDVSRRLVLDMPSSPARAYISISSWRQYSTPIVIDKIRIISEILPILVATSIEQKLEGCIFPEEISKILTDREHYPSHLLVDRNVIFEDYTQANLRIAYIR